jgi:hypothetical protein
MIKPHHSDDDSGVDVLIAEVVWLCDRLAEGKDNLAIDLRTAVDVAIRDLQEIENHWGPGEHVSA